MAELSRRNRRILLIVHVIVSVGWLGAGAANVVLGITALRASGVPPYWCYRMIEVIDTWLVIPVAFSALVTGLVLGVGTPWGLIRHWWVLTKLVLTVATIVFSTFGVGVWVEISIRQTAQHLQLHSTVGAQLVVGGFANIVGFVVMTWLSVAKPRGVTPWSRTSQRPDPVPGE